MKSLICYASVHHGNTKKIAEAMAHAIGAELIAAKDLKTRNVSGYDLAGFGSGIYFSKHHASVLSAVEDLPPVPGTKAFVFSTAGFPVAMFLFHRTLKTKLAAKGFAVAGEFSCKGLDTYKFFGTFGGMNKGHPDENDIKKAKESVKGIAQNLP